MMKISLILLAGGRGERMGAPLPKQFISLNNKPIARHSLDIFAKLSHIQEIIMVCPSPFHHLFSDLPICFAAPGAERQHSVFNGLQKVSPHSEWILIHDAARPFITAEMIIKLLNEGSETGAASLALPVKNTIKEVREKQHVSKTLDRSLIWEIQTPQLLKKDLLEAGFRYAQSHSLTVTDDVSLAELVGHPVKLVHGAPSNIKITTPDDLLFAEWYSTQIAGSIN